MAELLRDMERQMEIIQDAGQLKLKQDMNAIIKGVFTLASIIY
jgi:hypothetical protein